MLKTLRIFLLVPLLLASLHTFTPALTAPVFAADPYGSNAEGKCKKGDVKLSVPLQSGKDCLPKDEDSDQSDNPIYAYIRGVVKFASGIFGLLVIGMIIWSGYLYITSQGNSEQYKTAKSRLTQAITGLVLYILMFGILEYLIPGNILN